MSESKHTPGPWGVEEERYELSDDGTLDMLGYAVIANPNKPKPRHQEIAFVEYGPDDSEANAALIAAAPDLLAELKAVEWSSELWLDNGAIAPLCPRCDSEQDDGHRPDCTLAAAIAKAEGGAS